MNPSNGNKWEIHLKSAPRLSLSTTNCVKSNIADAAALEKLAAETKLWRQTESRSSQEG